MRRAAALALALAGCGVTASPDPGYGALLSVDGAQFQPGPFPAASGGPATTSVQTAHATVTIGEHRERLTAVLDGSAHAAIVGIAGAEGTWIVPAGPPDFDTPGQASVHAVYGISPAMTPGTFSLVVAAVDASGRIGSPAQVDLVAVPETPPDGDLVIGLTWPGAADLDLHVVDPLGGEAWSGNPNTWVHPPPGEPVDPDAYLTGGILDHDGNASCHRDSAPSEHVIWKTRVDNMMNPVAPIIPPGKYAVRVDARSLCGDASAPWTVAVYSKGTLIGEARGIATQDDADEAHGPGAGVTALTPTLP